MRNGDSEKVIPGQWFLFIGEDHREPGCTIKGHTKRYTPLHPEVVKRLIPYMEKQVAEHGHGPLFRHLPKDKNGKRSTYVASSREDDYGVFYLRPRRRDLVVRLLPAPILQTVASVRLEAALLEIRTGEWCLSGDPPGAAEGVSPKGGRSRNPNRCRPLNR